MSNGHFRNDRPGGLFFDPILDLMQFPDEFHGFMRLPAMRRLHGISMGSTFAEVSRVHPASRHPHIRHVVQLALLVRELPGFREDPRFYANIPYAAAMHDPHGPASHGSEPYMELVLGVDHEGLASQILKDPERAEGDWIEHHGGSVDVVCSLIDGSYPVLGGVLAGPRMNIDTMMNMYYQGIAHGIFHPLKQNDNLPWPNPIRLAQCYRIHKGILCFAEEAEQDLLGEDAVRSRFYGLTTHLSFRTPEVMQDRAHGLAYAKGCLQPFYFTEFTDYDACTYLATQCDPETRAIMGKLLRAEDYYLVWEDFVDRQPGADTSDLRRWKKLASHTMYRHKVADKLARLLGLAPHEVAVYISTKDRAYKGQLEMPLLCADGSFRPAPPPIRKTIRAFHAQVFTAREISKSQWRKIDGCMKRYQN